jgi:hypothetical protein
VAFAAAVQSHFDDDALALRPMACARQLVEVLASISCKSNSTMLAVLVGLLLLLLFLLCGVAAAAPQTT